MSARKTERLLNLVIALLATRRYLSVEQIFSAVPGYGGTGPEDEAFRRMFERDKQELRELGIPLETGSDSIWDDEPGYRIARRDYELPDIALEPDEAAALGLAARLWQSATLAQPASTALLKLRAAGVDVDEEGLAGLEPRVETTEAAFAPCLAAVRARRRISFHYRTAGVAVTTPRLVDPWGVVSWHGHWYVVGHDHDRAATRVFRLSRVIGAVSAVGPPDAVVPPAGVDLLAAVSQLEAGGAATPDQWASVRVRPGRGYELRRQARGERPGRDGWDEIDVPYADTERLAEQVVGYGTDAVVDGPPELREAVIARLRAVAELAL